MNLFRTSLLALTALSLVAPAARAAVDRDAKLTVGWAEPIDVLNPALTSARDVGPLLINMFDTLVWLTPELKATPALAKSWTLSPDGKTYTFTLRDDVTFQNGDKFSADDVVFTFNYVVSPDSKVVTRQNVDWIKGAEKVGDYQVRILLKAPFPAALEYLSGPTPIYPAAYFKKTGLEGFSKAPIGTGPYKITSVTPGVGVTMVKNTGYFKDSPLGTPKIGTI
ncbi:MAG TPA: ABC transporter substrate-binding protein, partial [Acetobacteraceae bacterium]|nr:ABC transporter substrate-binding protein [Acetobacteraceae bacterium]